MDNVKAATEIILRVIAIKNSGHIEDLDFLLNCTKDEKERDIVYEAIASAKAIISENDSLPKLSCNSKKFLKIPFDSRQLVGRLRIQFAKALKAEIKNKFGTLDNFSEKYGKPNSMVSRMLNGKSTPNKSSLNQLKKLLEKDFVVIESTSQLKEEFPEGYNVVFGIIEYVNE